MRDMGIMGDMRKSYFQLLTFLVPVFILIIEGQIN